MTPATYDSDRISSLPRLPLNFTAILPWLLPPQPPPPHPLLDGQSPVFGAACFWLANRGLLLDGPCNGIGAAVENLSHPAT